MPLFAAAADALKNRLFRWNGSDGTAPLVLTQRRIFILPTGAGTFFAAVIALMLLGAINYSLALGHALVFLLVGLGVTGMLHTFRNLAGISISGGRSDSVFAGETAHFPLYLANSSRLARIGLEFHADGTTVACDIPPQGWRLVRLPVAAVRRGWLELPRLRLSSRYPLGLFVAWAYPRPQMRCLVYPRPQPFPLPAPSGSAASGDRLGSAGSEDFAGLRIRQPADSPRHVAWKAVARDFDQRPLLVKEFAGGARDELWLDWTALPAAMDAETRLSCLAAWVLAADAARLPYGLRLPGLEIAPAQGEAQRLRCLEQLALFGQP